MSLDVGNPGDREYVDDLKSVLVEMLACMAFSLVSPKPNKKMFEYYPKILEFVVNTCSKQADPTLVLIILYFLGVFEKLLVFDL